MKKIFWIVILLFCFEFVKAANINDVIKELKKDESFKKLAGENAEVLYEDDSLKISFTGSENKYEFVFPIKDGILDYKSKKLTNYNDAVKEAVSSIFASIIINKTLILNDFNQTEINDFKTSNKIASFEKNGFELIEGEKHTFSKDESTISVSEFSLKIDFQKAKLDNRKLNRIILIISIVLVVIASFITFIILKRKSKIKLQSANVID